MTVHAEVSKHERMVPIGAERGSSHLSDRSLITDPWSLFHSASVTWTGKGHGALTWVTRHWPLIT